MICFREKKIISDFGPHLVIYMCGFSSLSVSELLTARGSNIGNRHLEKTNVDRGEAEVDISFSRGDNQNQLFFMNV